MSVITKLFNFWAKKKFDNQPCRTCGVKIDKMRDNWIFCAQCLAGARSMLPEIEALEKRNARLRTVLELISGGSEFQCAQGERNCIAAAREALQADEAGG